MRTSPVSLVFLALIAAGCASRDRRASEPTPEAPDDPPAAETRRREPASQKEKREDRRDEGGRRTAAASNAVIRDHRADFRACYDRARAERPELAGKIELAFRILPDGTVKDAEVDDAKSELHDAGLARCLVSVVTGITFPRSSEEVGSKMHYPFDFQPGGAR